ncbi:MAG TPA: TetR/AcrR family transcriptional regulator [Phenylobacterium sp.]|jgi:AcrR family transcriptional regulator|uniref:TetR/AcrR family transcriptional regulator n=1 Tax=Phenylobacterium sp. TaxID=1871053 RepID=UPI002D6E0B4B|nr:TetR/AcrR family transcriptional regulator [Phenylobacterium sp.]HZZ68221.1 TetR/AcrR family transcriptional regulator [Phenylobacterium sp.]
MSRAPAVRSPTPNADGRRRRGEDNRAKIVAAMLEIIHAGEIAPSAEQVAQRADVGLRTVFRHFQDMDSLYREMSVVIAKELHGAAERPFVSQDWRERVVELIARRSWAFEKIGPFLRASSVFRYRSKFLDADNADLATALRAILKRQLPPAVARDQAKLEILDLLLSFETWSRLRREQGLAPKRAREVLETAVRRLLD